jgi:leucyl aminopeptidase
MNISIEYHNNFNVKNNNFVIFLSNLSQLKSIEIPVNLEQYTKNKEFIKILNRQKHINISNIKSDLSTLLNIKIVLINLSDNNALFLGSSLYDEFNKYKSKNISFILSKSLQSPSLLFFADIVFGFCLKSYTFTKYKNDNLNESIISTIYLFNIKKFKPLNYKLNLLHSINFTKDLISEPANILNPVTYSEICKNLKIKGLKINVLDKNKLESIGMRSLLGVAKGSGNEPRVVIFEWNTKKKIKPIVLVGKGVTFDTGGISLKSSAGMEEMITDMGGSAVVVGSMINAALNKSPQSLVGIIGLVENMPDGKSQRPGDIIKSLSGQTIEILNTDAEGRLVLADILTYIQSKFKPKLIIDFATLTGAIMIALGTHRAGLFSNNDKLSKSLEIAGETSGEKLWRLPIGPEYDNDINSSRADMKNIGSSRFGGSIHAAQFIKRFVNDSIPWAHIDIAGVSWNLKPNQNSFSKLHAPGATAFGVRLIDNFLKGK